MLLMAFNEESICNWLAAIWLQLSDEVLAACGDQAVDGGQERTDLAQGAVGRGDHLAGHLAIGNRLVAGRDVLPKSVAAIMPAGSSAAELIRKPVLNRVKVVCSWLLELFKFCSAVRAADVRVNTGHVSTLKKMVVVRECGESLVRNDLWFVAPASQGLVDSMPMFNLRSPCKRARWLHWTVQPASLPDTALAASNISDLHRLRIPESAADTSDRLRGCCPWQILSVSIDRLICVL